MRRERYLHTKREIPSCEEREIPSCEETKYIPGEKFLYETNLSRRKKYDFCVKKIIICFMSDNFSAGPNILQLRYLNEDCRLKSLVEGCVCV